MHALLYPSAKRHPTLARRYVRDADCLRNIAPCCATYPMMREFAFAFRQGLHEVFCESRTLDARQCTSLPSVRVL